MASMSDGTDAAKFVVTSSSSARRKWYRRIQLILTDNRRSTSSASIHTHTQTQWIQKEKKMENRR